MKLLGISMLSIDDYKKNRDVIPLRGFEFLLRNGNEAVNVVKTGEIEDFHYIHMYYSPCDSYPVTPVILFDKLPCRRGDKIEFAGHRWTVISDTQMFVDDKIGDCWFGKTWDCSKSRFLPYVENWLEIHKDDPIYLLGTKKKLLK